MRKLIKNILINLFEYADYTKDNQEIVKILKKN